MSTALVFTPDRRFFEPALRTAGWALAQADSGDFDVVFACEAADVPPLWERLPEALAGRIRLITADFAPLIAGAAAHGNFSSAVFRRLVLHRLLPSSYSRYMPMDADMFVAGPGLGRLASLDLKGHVMAASLDMIRLMDCKGGDLAAHFRQYREALGLSPDAPYFNNGLTVIDRAQWEDGEWGERAIDFISRNPELTPFLDQSAINHLLQGRIGTLSPRCNFMGDFQLLDLENEIRPFIYHFVNSPKPWSVGYKGDARFAALYKQADLTPRAVKLPPGKFTNVDQAFRERLVEFLKRQEFLD